MIISKRIVLVGAIVAGTAFGYAAPASAQATRTWVSGVGDDVNPCSRTAPCKTFAGAISKTAAGGEINCLDPGGFGAVTINKAMTISCPYTEGGALAGGNGIVVNAGATDVVFLRGLDIFGVNPPSNGVRFVAGAGVVIEDSVIRRFNAANSFGVSFQPSGASFLVIRNTTIADNGNAATGGGVLVKPTGASGSGRVTLSNVSIVNNANLGFSLDTTGATSAAGTFVTIDGSLFARNVGGVKVLVPVGASPTTSMINNTTFSQNSGTAIAGDGASATIRVGKSLITGNGVGISIANGSFLRSYGDNINDGNAVDGAFGAGILPKE
jgi:hypothetical protein